MRLPAIGGYALAPLRRMNTVVSLKKYTKPEDIKHVMYDKQEIEQIYHCEVCGDLQVISGSVWHIRPIEDHN